MDLSFYKGKRVLVTGHTGFKGAWLCKMLTMLGADVTGYALEPPTEPNLFGMLKLPINSVIGDIRDFDKLKAVFDDFKPEIVLHLAAQPIVRDSYKMPRYTYDVNVMGSVNICECIRLSDSVKSFLNVTTDKVYENEDLNIAFTEDMKLDGYDPYSNSKSCSELVTHSYQKSFLNAQGVAVSTARAGNVIGGGDFANDRIVPDSVRAVMSGEQIIVRNPYSTRPFQHVLEPLYVYLLIAMKQYENREFAGYYNVGPDDSDCITTGELCDIFCKHYGVGAEWKNISEKNAVHEAGFLRLDTSKLKSTFGWKPVWNIDTALLKVVEWTKVYAAGGNVDAVCEAQIKDFSERI
ncbi:MAG: CDP-glucose 4,6-dehydratase [Eubacterium sp.]|nr:CDP-glucose 4,6-dehydratase [Eubacterium sp.]